MVILAWRWRWRLVPTYIEEWRCEEPKYLACWRMKIIKLPHLKKMKIAFLKLLKIEDLKTPLKKCEKNEDHVVCMEPLIHSFCPGIPKLWRLGYLLKKSHSFLISIPCDLCEKPWCYLAFWFKYRYGSTDLHTSVAQEHLRSDILLDTTVSRQESNTGPRVRKTHALPIAPGPLPIRILVSIPYIRQINLPLTFKAHAYGS